MFRAIGSCLMAIVNGVASILTGVIHAIASFFNILISFLTCGYCGRKRSRTTTSRV